MAVKVYIQKAGEKGSGTYEIDSFPVEKENGLLTVTHTPTVGKNKGSRKIMQINIAQITEIRPVENNKDGNPDFDQMPEE